MYNLLEQKTKSDADAKAKAKAKLNGNSNSVIKPKDQPLDQSDADAKAKAKAKLKGGDKTTIPSPPQPQPDNVDQTSSVKLTPKTNPSYKIWVEWSRQVGKEVLRPEFVKAIQTAYFKDK